MQLLEQSAVSNPSKFHPCDSSAPKVSAPEGSEVENLYTIGHSNHAIESLLALLQQHHITAVADVRSQPYSRRLPQFCKEPLKRVLNNANIHYVFLGKELGARPDDPRCYLENGMALYDRIAATQQFEQGIQRILTGATQYRIALLCAEKDPLTCHRSVLVCRHLQRQGLKIQHILPDGALESQTELEARMLTKLMPRQKSPALEAMGQLSLFTDAIATPPPVSLAEAYEQQGRAIAYVSPTPV